MAESSGKSVGRLLSEGLTTSAGNESVDLGLVGGVGHEGGELAVEAFLRELEQYVELVPELLFVALSRFAIDLNAVEAEGLHHAGSSLVALILGKEAEVGVEVGGERGVSLDVDVVTESSGIAFGDLALLNEVSEAQLEEVLSVVLPHSAEVRLFRDEALVLVWVHHVLLGEELRYELASGLPLLLELLTALWGSGVNAENELVLLVSLCETVQSIVGVVEMATISEPIGLWKFVVEQSGGRALTPLLKSEPVENVRLHSLTSELHGGPLGVQVVHGVLPSLSGIGIELPTVLLLSGGPVGDLEALEEGTRASVEVDVSHTLEQGLGVEVLGVNVVLDVWLLVEFIAIEVLDSNTYIILN